MKAAVLAPLRLWTRDPERLLGFLAVGILATLVYALLASAFHRLGGAPAPAASFAAYALASSVSWFGHRGVTFAGRPAARGAAWQFAALTVFGFAVSILMPALLVDRLGLPIEAAVLATAVTVPAVNFTVMDRLLFAEARAQAPVPARPDRRTTP